MAKTLCFAASASNATSTANTTQYMPIIGDKQQATTETDVQIPFRTPGTIYSLGIRISANSVNNSTVFTLRKNATDTASTITVATTQTGWFEDISDQITVAAGDLLDLKSVPASGSTGTFTILIVKTEFDTTTSTTLTVTRVGATVGTLNTGHTAASTTYYYMLQSAIPTGGTTNTTESTSQVYQQYSATLKNLAVKFPSNSRTTTTAVRIRKNAANGNSLCNVTSGVTTWVEDTTNTDSVVVTDKVNYSITTGTGTSADSLLGMVCDYVTTTNPGVGICNFGYSTVQSIAKATTNYFMIAGKFNNATTTEALAQTKINDAYTFKGLTIVITANTIAATSNVTFRKNGADTTMTIAIASTQTGTFSDLSHTVACVAGDLVNSIIVTGTSTGTVTMSVQNVTVYTEIAGQSTSIDCSVTSQTLTNKFITIV